MKLTNKQICAVVIVLSIFAFVFILGLSLSGKTGFGGKGFTRLYFNADTDLPDSSLYLKNMAVHELEVNKTYCVKFTIASFEKRPITYTYVVESEVLGLTKQVTLLPGETETVCLTIIPGESDKWKLDSTTTGEWENVIDLTRDSWIAEWSGLEIVESDDGLPTRVGSRFGGILHANISIDELRIKPLVTEHVTEREGDFEKTRTIDLINLSVEGDKLYLNAESEELKYTSDEQLFRIKLLKSVDSQEIRISPESYIEEEEQEIYFWYRIK